MGQQIVLGNGCRLPALQLRHLNEVAAGIVQHGDLGCGHVFRWHGELGTTIFHAVVIGLHVVGVEHGRWLALLKQGLLISFGRWVVVERQLEFSASGSSGEATVSHRYDPWLKSFFFTNPSTSV